MNKDQTSLSEIIAFIEHLLSDLDRDGHVHEAFGHIEACIDVEIPNIYKRLMSRSDDFSFVDRSRIFGDYTLYSPWEAHTEFFNRVGKEIPDVDQIEYEDLFDYVGRYQNGDQISTDRLFPIAHTGHRELLINLNNDVSEELLGVEYGTFFHVFAPNLKSHLTDLSKGIDCKRYVIQLNQVYFSEHWLERAEMVEKDYLYSNDYQILDRTGREIKKSGCTISSIPKLGEAFEDEGDLNEKDSIYVHINKALDYFERLVKNSKSK